MDRKRKIDLVFGIAALALAVFVAWFLWRIDWGKTARFLVATIGPGGTLFSPILVKGGLQPWQGLSLQLAVVAAALAVPAVVSRSAWTRRSTATFAAACLCLAAFWWWRHAGVDFPPSDTGFPVARFTKGDRTLTFIGERHISDLEYYMAMNAEVAKLTAEGREVFYEEAPDVSVCRTHAAADISTYGIDPTEFLTSVIVTPIVWPSADWWSKWHMADLKTGSEAHRNAASAGEACFEALNDARDDVVADAIDGSGAQKVGAHYGSAHLYRAVDRLAKRGWTLVSIEILPAGRKAPPPD